eukprot:UN00743
MESLDYLSMSTYKKFKYRYRWKPSLIHQVT